jgi:hypothetical protein
MTLRPADTLPIWASGSVGANARILPNRRTRSEAELGERIMRALILRRIGLMETGAGGPVIVGRADSGRSCSLYWLGPTH